jgi:hypothetical protein
MTLEFLTPENVLLILVLVGQGLMLVTKLSASLSPIERRVQELETWRHEHELAHEEIYVRKDVVGAKLDSIERRLVSLEEKLDTFARKPRR